MKRRAFLTLLGAGMMRPALAQPSPSSVGTVVPAPFRASRDIELLVTSQPTGLITLRRGGLAFAAPGISAIAEIAADTEAVRYFELGKSAMPMAVAEGPDGRLYATDKVLNVIHRINPATGEIDRITMPGSFPNLDLRGLRFDSGGTLWFAGYGGWLGRYTPGTGRIEISANADFPGLSYSASGPDGAVWFFAGRSRRLIRIEADQPRHRAVALPRGFRGIRGASIAPDGRIWISSFRQNLIAHVDGSGRWRVVTLPFPESQPQAILAMADGSVLVADIERRLILHYDLARDRFLEFAALGPGGAIRSMVVVPKGIAVSDAGADRIRIFLIEKAASN